MSQNCSLAEQITAQGHSLTDELQTDLTNNYDILVQNKIHIKQKMKQLEQKVTEDNSSFVESIKVNIYNLCTAVIALRNAYKYVMDLNYFIAHL